MSANTFTGLTPKQEEGIIALLNQPTVTKAAEAIGVNEKTVYRWLDETAFSRAYRKCRREAFSQAIALCQKYAPHAVQVLMKVANDPATPPSAKVAAAGMLIKFSRESLELDDLAQRLEALEAAQAAPALPPHQMPPEPQPMQEAA